jgi:ABC-type antimicrobial peptide transport system permease subunit
MEAAPRPRTVVGIVADVRQRGLETPSRMAVYLPYDQDTTRRSLRAMMLFARTAGEPESMSRSLQAEVRAIGPDVPVQLVSTLETAIRRSLASRVFSLVLLGCFAAVAVLLAAAGLYGVISYSVARRVREIGIRMALGARKADVLRAVFARELGWLAGGLVAGLSGASALARFLRGMLFGVEPGDAWTFLAVICILLVVAALACWAPAARATRVDPVRAIREE